MYEPAGLQSDAPTITDPVWDRTVSADEIVKLYPRAALRLVGPEMRSRSAR